jgi:hypothetical protein
MPLTALAIVGATTGRWDALIAPALVAIALSGVVVVLCSKALSSLVVALDSECLTVRIGGWMFPYRVQRAEIMASQIRTVDLAEHTEFRPRWRTLGISIPLSLQGGHFHLRNRAKAFCLVTDPGRVTIVPTTRGKMLLLSLVDPASFRHALQS